MKNWNKKIGLMIAATTLGSGLLISLPGYAGTTENIKIQYVDRFTGAKLNLNEKVKVDFDGWRHVEKLKVNVKGPIPGFTVFSNGVAHTPEYFPGGADGQAYYQCPLNEAANQVEFLANGPAELGRVSYEYADRAVSVPNFGGAGMSFPAEDVRKIIQAVEALSQYVSLDQQEQYLLPIKTAAGHALAMEYGRGSYSMLTNQSVQALIAQIDFANDFINQEMQISAVYDWAVYLLSVKERLTQITE